MNNLEKQIRARINGNYLIGRYESTPGSQRFIDIRGSEGEQLDMEDIFSNELSIPYIGRQLVDKEFYQFEWKVNEAGEIQTIGDILPVNKEALMTKLLDIFKNKKGMDLADAIKNQDLVLREVTGSVKTYLYELLQNANDYPFNKEDVHVKFILTDHYLFFVHTGTEFDLLNIVGICSIHQGDKRNKKNAIGYKGIGFKTVFVKNNYVYLRSGEWGLRFDEKKSMAAFAGGKAPWIRMPWQTSFDELDDEAKDVLNELPHQFRVQFALRHSEDASQNIEQLDEVFGNDEILLFIPNVTDVEVKVKGELTHHVTKDKQHWEIRNYSYPVPSELREWVKKDIKDNGKTPPKFKDIEAANISFAVERDGNVLLPMSNTRVYNYLPTEVRLGLPFIINADFIPDASRSGLQRDLKWNTTIMEQVGTYFVRWLVDMLSAPDSYDINSVFSLIPKLNPNDGHACLFKNGMTAAFDKLACIPTLNNGHYGLHKPSEIILDTIGLTEGDNPLLTDEEFYKFCNIKGLLPHPDLRGNYSVKQLLRGHKCKTFDESSFSELIKTEAFKSWLKNEENSIQFLTFLLNKNYFKKFASFPIILSENGDIRNAEYTYFCLDDYLEDIGFLSHLLPRVNTNVREALRHLEGFSLFKSKLREFNPTAFVRDVIFRDFSSVQKYFNTLENSANFIHFLSVCSYSDTIPAAFPIFAENQLNCKHSVLYVKDEWGQEIASKGWINQDWINFIHYSYFQRDKDVVERYLQSKGFKILNEEVVSKVIFNDNARVDYIAEVIVNNFDLNLDLFSFLSSFQWYQFKFSEHAKENFTVFTTDGTTEYTTPIRDIIFIADENWSNIKCKEWVPKNLANAISPKYFENNAAIELKKFFSTAQITRRFSIEGFYQAIIKNNLETIFALITTKEISRDFLHFLYRNESSIFHGEVPGSIYKKVPVLLEGDSSMTSRHAINDAIYFHTSELDNLTSQEWFYNELNILDVYYNDLFDGEDKREFFNKIGFQSFKLHDYIVDIVLDDCDYYIENLDDRGINIQFHKYFSHIHKKFTEDELKPLQQLPIFLSNCNDEETIKSDKSTNHYLPSDELSELIQSDLVPPELMDSIHPDYISGEEDLTYYIDKLGNVKINIEGFLRYITSEGNRVEVIEYLKKDKARNIRFWRWICGLELESEITQILSQFPIIINSADGSEQFSTADNSYLPDSFFGTMGMQDFIYEYYPQASFISSEYKEVDDHKDWVSFFSKIGVIHDNKNFVFKRIIPNLDSYKNINIVMILSQYTGEISEHITKDQEFKEQLSHLNLLCVDGAYKNINDIIITGQYFDLDGIILSDIVPEYFANEIYLTDCPKGEERKVKDFMKLIADTYNVSLDTLTKIRDEKIYYFCNNQSLYHEDKNLHYRIIKDIAESYAKDKVGVARLLNDDSLPIIKLYTINEHLKDANLLTLSSAFAPNCDFMQYGVDELDYVSEEYASLSPRIKEFFISQLNIDDGFYLDDLCYLKNREFALYFWKDYAPRSRVLLEDILTAANIKDVQCIPTINGIACPKDLYDYRIADLRKMVERLSSGETTDKLPSIELPNWIKDTQLGFRSRLYFEDCISYLKLNTTDFRRKVYSWITSTPDEIIARHSKLIEEYKLEAKWMNGKGEWVPLSSLVALEKESKTLDAYFKSNPGVCNPSYMPDYIYEYNTLCNTFDIPIITDEDFSKVPEGRNYADEEAIKEIKKRLLYISFITGKDKWLESYKTYEQAIDNTDIRRCDTISYKYNDVIRTDLKVYTDSNTKLWYTRDWHSSPVNDIMQWIRRVMKIDIEEGLMRNIFWDEMSTILSKYEGGEIPEEFYGLLEDADKKGLSIKQKEAEQEFQDSLCVDSINPNANYEGIEIDGKVVQASQYTRTMPTNNNVPSSHSSDKLDENISDTCSIHSANATIDPDKQADNASISDDYLIDKKSEASDSISEIEGSYNNNETYEDEVIDSSEEEEEDFIELEDDEFENIEKDVDETTGSRPKKQVNNTHSIENTKSSAKEETASVKRESAEERLKKEWEQKINTTIRKPHSHSTIDSPYTPQSIENKTASVDTFFASSSTEHAGKMSAASKTSQRINRSCTDAQKTVEDAMDKVDIHNMFLVEDEKNKYSFLWFKLLMELMYSDRKKESRLVAQVDFSDQKLSGDMLVLSTPSKAIPKWITNADKLSVSIIKNGKVESTANAFVTSLTEDAVWVCFNSYEDISIFEEKIGRIRLNAEGTSFSFIESLITRFIKLGYEDTYNLKENLPNTIEYIYGPPGTGKTHELVLRLLSIISDENTWSDTIVLTPTNRAADEIVERLIKHSVGKEHCFRYGDTQSETILQSTNLISRNSYFSTFDGPKVLVTTAARFAYDYLDPDNAICEWPWDNIFIDEASMIDIVTTAHIIYQSLQSNEFTKIVIAGDPHQIQPVETNDIKPENIYDMVGLNSLSNAVKRDDVMALTTQYRSISEIGDLVSKFTYDGMLNHARGPKTSRPLRLTGYDGLEAINFVGFKTEPLDYVYGIDSIGGSAFHLYSVILAYNFAEYLVNEVTKLGYTDYSIGIVCPFRAQSDAIRGMLESRPIDNLNCTIQCGTVHKFQGSECDSMIVIMNTPLEVTSGSHVNDPNLVNVAISRAKDYLFIMTPDHSVNKFWTREALGKIASNKSIKFGPEIEKIIFGREKFIEENINISAHMPVNVYYEPSKLYEVKIDETAVDIQINEIYQSER